MMVVSRFICIKSKVCLKSNFFITQTLNNKNLSLRTKFNIFFLSLKDIAEWKKDHYKKNHKKEEEQGRKWKYKLFGPKRST